MIVPSTGRQSWPHLTKQSGVTGPRLGLDDFPESQLHSFGYTQGRTSGFEIRDRCLENLAAGPDSQLRKFCWMVFRSVITACLQRCPIMMDELRDNFMLALLQTMSVVEIKIRYAWYWKSLTS